MRTAAALVLCSTCLVGVVSARDDDAKKAQPALEGTWKVVGMEAGGSKVPEADLEGSRWVIKGNTYTFTLGGMIEKGKLRLDADKKPATIDVEITEGSDKGKTQVGIWKLENDRLTVCCAAAGDKERPKEFATKTGTMQLLFAFKREAP